MNRHLWFENVTGAAQRIVLIGCFGSVSVLVCAVRVVLCVGAL